MKQSPRSSSSLKRASSDKTNRAKAPKKHFQPTLDERLKVLEEAYTKFDTIHPKDKLTIIAFSGDMDKLMAAFIIATGALAMGTEVTIFFTFWGLAALKKRKTYIGKPIINRLLTLMLPGTPKYLGTSKLNFGGLGAALFRCMMRKKNVPNLPELIHMASNLGAKMVACQMTVDLLGLKPEELIDGVEVGGVTTFLESAAESKTTLFI